MTAFVPLRQDLLLTTKTGCTLIPPKMRYDARGYFCELWRASVWQMPGPPFDQDNVSVSNKGVVRGMHLQIKKPQAKLVRVVNGLAVDCVVDCRPSSPNFGAMEWWTLDHDSPSLFIPAGFAHGFWALEGGTVLYYKCSKEHDESHGIGGFNPQTFGIDFPWAGEPIVLSESDRNAPSFDDFKPCL